VSEETPSDSAQLSLVDEPTLVIQVEDLPKLESMPEQPVYINHRAEEKAEANRQRELIEGPRKDWANSPLFDCIIKSHSAVLFKQGLVSEKQIIDIGIKIQLDRSDRIRVRDLLQNEVRMLQFNLK
jgi:hypothetical protein